MLEREVQENSIPARWSKCSGSLWPGEEQRRQAIELAGVVQAR